MAYISAARAISVALLLAWSTPTIGQSTEEEVSPAPSGREDTETTVFSDGTSISMPGKDADTPSPNPVDWGDWKPGHDDDTTVVFKPDPAPAPEPAPDTNEDSSEPE
jgi:hypothetical protein